MNQLHQHPPVPAGDLSLPFEESRLEDIEQSVPQHFKQQAARYPGHLAASGRHYRFTYEELNAAAYRFAHGILWYNLHMYQRNPHIINPNQQSPA